MRNKALSGVFSFIITFIIAFGCMPISSEAQKYTVDEVQNLIDGIVSYKVNEAGAEDVSGWIEKSLPEGAGVSADWYAIALSQDGAEGLSYYRAALEKYLSENSVQSAVTREKYALALCAVGSQSSYISDILEDSVGGQGIMSYIYGLHILNNGYSGSSVTADGVVTKLLSMQLTDGGWALWGEYGDIDVTAMTINALAPYYSTDKLVSEAVDRALELLSAKQQADGGYNSFGSSNPESASQVLTALSALGIDCQEDERFIKNGSSPIDGVIAYRLEDGSFSHIKDGASNESATFQAYYSFIAYKRMKSGKGPLLVMDNRKPTAAEVTTTSTTTVTTTARTLRSALSSTSESAAEIISDTVTASAVTSTAASKASTSASAATAVTSSASGAAGEITITTSEAVQPVTGKLLPEAPEPKNHKPVIITIIIGAAGVLSLGVFAAGKRNYKNFLFIGGAAAAAVIFVLMTDIRTKDEYYHGGRIVKDDPIGTVTLEIRCDTIAGRSDSEYIPADGTILEATEFEIEEGETVFDILTQAAQTYCIQVENKGSSGGAHGMVYIAGINYIYEFDFGDLSGWVYHVNGVAPSRGCGDYVLSDGDRIEWLYTCELGHDLNEVYE